LFFFIVYNNIYAQKTSFFAFFCFYKYNKTFLKNIKNSFSTFPKKQTPKQKANRTKRKYLKNKGVSLSKILNEFSIIKKKNLLRQTYKTKTTKPKQFKKKSVPIRSISPIRVPITEAKKINSCIRGKKTTINYKKPYFPFFNLSNQVNPHHIKTLFPYKKNSCIRGKKNINH